MTERALPPEFPEEQLLAASAVADGTATDADRAVVDADPDLAELVRRMRTVTDELRTVDPPSVAWQDRSLAAALEAAEALAPATAPNATTRRHGTSSPVTTIPPTERRRTRWATSWSRPVFAAAAALALVAVAGAVVIPGLGGGNDDQIADAPSTFDAELERSTTDDDEASDGASAMIAAESGEDVTDADDDVTADADPAGDDAGDTSSGGAAESVDNAPSDAVRDELADVDLRTPDVLSEWVARVVDLDPDALVRPGDTEASPCPDPDGLGPAWSLGTARIGPDAVVIVTDGRDAAAVDPATCDVRLLVRDVGD